MDSRIIAEQKLKSIFGLDHFYDEQWKAIQRLLNGERILMIERTGFGKSLCYQYPATQFPGLTIIFSPLIALMRDQVAALKRKGISAAFINSEQSSEDNTTVIKKALEGKYKMLYIAPERQENKEWEEAVRKMNISMVVIDEAHTISVWGHDFRPAFRRIINLVQLLPASLPILATTATATRRVQADIEQQIGGKLTTIRGSLVRQNFMLQVMRVKSEEEKMIWLAQNLNLLDGNGLIYTGTRQETANYAGWLRSMGISAIDYNAGYDAAKRIEVEQGLMENRWKCIVSTNALGMGIDKPDIRFIIHTQIPVSPIHYYQEIGRAGRDGKPTRIILFFNEADERGMRADERLPRSFIDTARPSINKYQLMINLLKEEPLSERELIQRLNIKVGEVRTMKYDLMDQGIIRETLYARTRKYEYRFDAPQLDTEKFRLQREAKLRDLDAMIGYVYTEEPRMQYLCRFLDSDEQTSYSNCDNTSLPKLHVEPKPEVVEKLRMYLASDFPELQMAEKVNKRKNINGNMYSLSVRCPKPDEMEIYRGNNLAGRYIDKVKGSDFTIEERTILAEAIKKLKQEGSHITDGVAGAFYGVSAIGNAIHHCKYEQGGDFPDFLIEQTVRAFKKTFGEYHFDLILFVPPTVSGSLVEHFAEKFAQKVNVPLSKGLYKTRATQEQKMFQNNYGKHDNVEGAFEINEEEEVKNKNIILLDDIYDSGATLKEIARMLTAHGARYISPVVIAKTVGGQL